MPFKMTIKDINNLTTSFKRQHNNIISNFVPGKITADTLVDVFQRDDGIAFVLHEEFVDKFYIVATNEYVFQNLLEQAPSHVMLEWLYRGSNAVQSLIEKSGWYKYSSFYRQTDYYIENPYSVPEIGRRVLLEEFYNPNCGEFAEEEDVDELYELGCCTFDPYGYDIFTKKKWHEIVSKKECLLYKESEKIVACYVWRVEGKKLYSNISINQTTADVLYSMERRIKEYYWNQGISCFYSWKSFDNKKAIERVNENPQINKIIKRRDYLYDDIFIRREK